MKEYLSSHILSSMRSLFLGLILVLFILPGAAEAKYRGEVAGWIPWWQADLGIESALKHSRNLDIIYPFSFEVRSDGSLTAKTDLNKDEWQELFKKADSRRIDVVPTITWFDGVQIHEILSDRKLRRKHIKEIVEMVDDGGYDGVNIDYEGKLADTIDYYSKFLKELKRGLGRDKLTCTIEARTPPEDLYREVPDNIRYANDYKAMDRYCDWVEIMAYDQQRADLTLNKERKGEPYNPVADENWVEKVIELALEDIDEDKIMLGVPTYGREWKLTVASEWYKTYESIGALNMPDIDGLVKQYDLKPGRNAAGELSFTYFPENSPFKILEVLPVPQDTRPGFEAAAQALLFADLTQLEVPVNLVWYSDAKAIEDKLKLAKKYNLRGVVIFKIDGEEDENIWDLF